MKAAIAIGVAITTLIVSPVVQAQTQSARDTATAYGARLTAEGQPANLNQQRVNSRISNRINSRLGLRIERYRPDTAANPAAPLQTAPDAKARAVPMNTLPPNDYEPQ